MATGTKFICKIWNKIFARTCDPTASTWNNSTERQDSFEIGMRSLQEECSLHLFQLSIVTNFPSCNIRASFDNLCAVSFSFMHTCWNKMSSNLLLTSLIFSIIGFRIKFSILSTPFSQPITSLSILISVLLLCLIHDKF